MFINILLSLYNDIKSRNLCQTGKESATLTISNPQQPLSAAKKFYLAPPPLPQLLLFKPPSSSQLYQHEATTAKQKLSPLQKNKKKQT